MLAIYVATRAASVRAYLLDTSPLKTAFSPQLDSSAVCDAAK
jgi:hypothetical protein